MEERDYCLDIAFTLKVAQLKKLSFSKLLINQIILAKKNCCFCPIFVLHSFKKPFESW